MAHYPTLRLGVLIALQELKAQYDVDQGYFDAKDCPYDFETVEVLKKLFKQDLIKIVRSEPRGVGGGGARGVGAPRKQRDAASESTLGDELEDLVAQMKELNLDTKGLDTGDKVAIIRAKTQLLDKIATIREKAFSMKRMSMFMNTIMQILEDVVDEAGREEVLKRLEPYRDQMV